MIIRRLKDNELYKASVVSSVAFEMPENYKASLEQAKEGYVKAKSELEIEEMKKTPLLSDGFAERTYAALDDDDKTLFGSVLIDSRTVRYDGKLAIMGTVGNVSTLPQYRRFGGIRGCMKMALKEMNEEDVTFSMLYPFSTAYYRKFGYEVGARKCHYTIKLSAIAASASTKGNIEQLFPGDDLSVLTKIYNEAYKDYNISAVRRIFDEKLITENTMEQARYIYVRKNEKNEPDGFMITKKVDGVLNCDPFIAVDASAAAELLQFAKAAFSSDYNAIRMMLPESFCLDYIVPEGNGISCARGFNGMIRVVNVEKALRLSQCKGIKKGRLKIEIKDDCGEWNNGVWAVEYENGKENVVSKTSESPDITLPINLFSVLLCGQRSADTIAYMDSRSVVVHNENARLEDLFYPKKTYCLDAF